MSQATSERETSERDTNRRFQSSRIAAAAFAVAGLSASLFAVSTAGAATKPASKSVVISTVKNKKLGTILISNNRTLYALKTSKTGCNAACQKIWPQVVLPKGVTKATAGPGTKASQLGTLMRSGGVRQVTYGGKALYWFSLDKASGQVKGNNFKDTWGVWDVIVTVKPTGSGTATTIPSGATGGTSTTVPGGGGTAF